MLSLLAVVLLSAEPDTTPPPPPPPPPAEVAPYAPPEGPRLKHYENRTRGWLKTELQQLQARRPTLVPQILVLATSLVGGGVAVGAGLRNGENAGGVFAGIAVACVVIAAVSAITLYLGMREQLVVDEKIAAVERELQRERPSYPPPPLPPPERAPTPPPPPGALLPSTSFGGGLALGGR